jgi:choline dehydrogenase-like flavoprotein
MLNTAGGFMFTNTSSEDDWFEMLKQSARHPTLRSVAALWKLRRDVCAGMGALLGSGFVYRPRAVASLGLTTEQEPSRESYVALSEDNDRFGLPKARLHWHISDKTWQTKRAFAPVMKAEIERLGFGWVTLIDPIVSGTKDWESLLTDTNHHMGGTRMSARAEDGVVDANMRVWGVPNLYVCSASVFPTSSHSNPTLTLLALCSRLIERLTHMPTS